MSRLAARARISVSGLSVSSKTTFVFEAFEFHGRISGRGRRPAVWRKARVSGRG
jgi:hypothetical protein